MDNKIRGKKDGKKISSYIIALLTVSDTRVIENDKSGNLLVKKIKIVAILFLIGK